MGVLGILELELLLFLFHYFVGVLPCYSMGRLAASGELFQEQDKFNTSQQNSKATQQSSRKKW